MLLSVLCFDDCKKNAVSRIVLKIENSVLSVEMVMNGLNEWTETNSSAVV